MTLAGIERAARSSGLALVGAFHPLAADKVPSGIGTLCLLGPDGPEMWRVFSQSAEANDAAPDPLDRWSRRVIGALAAGHRGLALFPFDGPPWHPFHQWAARAEGAVPSPVGMMVTRGRGLWASYRGALGVPQVLDLADPPPGSPCAACARPCLGACPVDAFAGGTYDVPRCVRHVSGPGGAACRDGCLVRKSCPAGLDTDLPQAERRFHMDAFLRTHAGV